MQYRTRGNASPKDKPKVYFTGHPEDCAQYFDSISHIILELNNCAVFYDENPEQPDDPENFLADLDRMQLIVLVITGKYVYGRTFAHDTVFQHAVKRHIPILPILEETGIEPDFNQKCGDLQFLTPHVKDQTEISFAEKLKKYLDAVLVGDELAEKVRAAFDAYVFLSYRKKDRKYAQELMRLIHGNSFCRDIAIWYDEFLVPGENFNESIQKAMQKSHLFALAVTPSLLENPNYVMTTEYPAAQETGKEIVPVILTPTDSEALQTHYQNLPEPIPASDTQALAAALSRALANVCRLENDSDPQHVFFIGLAYLNGIDVEVDHARALEMITFAAEHHLPEAVSKLVDMYRTGNGVARDYEKAIEWQRKIAALYQEEFERDQNLRKQKRRNGMSWLFALRELGDLLCEIDRAAEAKAAYQEMLAASERVDRVYRHAFSKRFVAFSYQMIGNMQQAERDYAGARESYEKCIAISRQLADSTEFATPLKDLFNGHALLGDICMEQQDFAAAKEYYEAALTIKEQHAQMRDAVDAQDLLDVQRDRAAIYSRLGVLCGKQGNPVGARAYHEQELAVMEQIAAQTESILDLNNLACICNNIARTYNAQDDAENARTYCERALALLQQTAERTGSVQVQRDLAQTYQNLGLLCHDQKDIEAAMQCFEQALAMREQIAEQTDSVQARLDLAGSYYNFSTMCVSDKNFPQATEYCEKALAIIQPLAERSDSVQAQRDLAKLYNGMAVIYERQEKFEQAREYHQLAVKIREQLAKQFKTAAIKDDLATSYFNLSFVSDQVWKKRVYLTAAGNLWLELAKAHPEVALYAQRVALVRQALLPLMEDQTPE